MRFSMQLPHMDCRDRRGNDRGGTVECKEIASYRESIACAEGLPLSRVLLEPFGLHLIKAVNGVLVKDLSIDDDRAFDAEHADKENINRFYIRRHVLKAKERFMWVKVNHLGASSNLNAVDLKRG